MKRYYRKKDRNNTYNFGVIIPTLCCIILVSCFLYQKVIESQYVSDCNCIYIDSEISPLFILIQSEPIDFDEVKLDDIQIFKKEIDSAIVYKQYKFRTGRKKIEFFLKQELVVSDSICLFSDREIYWLGLMKNDTDRKCHIFSDPIFLD